MLDNRVDKSSLWLYGSFLLLPAISLLAQWSIRIVRHHRFRLRIYLLSCFVVLEASMLAIINWVIKSFALVDPELINEESAFALLLFSALLFMFYWLWWGKISREKSDLKIIKNFQKVPDSKRVMDSRIVALLKSSSVLKHRFLANDAGEYFKEYIPVMMSTSDETIYFGAHYYDEQIRTSGQSKNYIHQTHRHAFWVFTGDLPDLELSKINHWNKVFGSIALNPQQRKLVNEMKKITDQYDFVRLEVRDRHIILIRKFLLNIAALGENPITTEEIAKINSRIREVISL